MYLHRNSKLRGLHLPRTLSARTRVMWWNEKSRNRSRSPSDPSPRPRHERHPSRRLRPRLLLAKRRGPKVQGPLEDLPHQRSGNSLLLMTKVMCSNRARNGPRAPVVVSGDETIRKRRRINALRTSGTILLDC